MFPLISVMHVVNEAKGARGLLNNNGANAPSTIKATIRSLLLLVEQQGIEPWSKHGINMLSTCLAVC